MKMLTFKVNEAQEKEFGELMMNEGYTNKSEFFRYLMKFYKFHQVPQAQAHSQTQTRTTETVEPKSPVGDEYLSERKRKLLADPNIWDEGVRELIRNMKD